MSDNRIFFRPSVVIFVDTVGQEVRTQPGFDTLLAYLDPPLRQGIGFIEYPVDAGEARGWFAHDTNPAETIQGALADIVRTMLHRANLDMLKEAINKAGYFIVNTRPQVFIVGHADEITMQQVLHIVHEQLENLDLSSSEACYFLSRHPSQPRDTKGDPAANTIPLLNREVATFCYLYEDMMMYPTPNTVTKEQSHYALLEAIFSLIATGISSQDRFARLLNSSMHLNGYEQVGNLSTCMVMFPRVEVRNYSGAHLGIEVIERWNEDIRKSKVNSSMRAEQGRQAMSAVEKIQEWIEDSVVRPGTEEIMKQVVHQDEKDDTNAESRSKKWPDLTRIPGGSVISGDLLRQDLLSTYKRVDGLSSRLFGLFAYNSIRKEHRQRRHTAGTWADIAYKRSSAASSAFVNWDGTATTSWKIASEIANESIKSTIDRLWTKSDNGNYNGLELARIYIDAYDDKLKEVAHLLSVWRRTHEETYEAIRSEFERLADGEWVTQGIVGGGNANTAGQAGPTMASIPAPDPQAQSAGQSGGNAPAGIQGQGQQQQRRSLYQHLPQEEDTIAQHLGQRITWEENRVPSPSNIVGMSLFAAPALVLVVLSFAPILSLNPLLLLGVVALIGGAIAVGNWFFRKLQYQNVIKLQKDLLRFYCYYYAYRCELREDQLRRLVIGPLRRRVQMMRERLDAIHEFLQELLNRLDKQRQDAHDRLFDGPAAIRDVFVANGAPLQKTVPGSVNTLKDFVREIHRLRSQEPKEAWHHPGEMRYHFLESFQAQKPSFIEMSLEEMERYVYDFVYPVVDTYLIERLVEISYALDREATWREVFSRIRPIYRTRVGMRDPELVFICGRQMDLHLGEQFIKRMQQDAIPLCTDVSNPSDWLLVAGFFRDRSPATALKIDALFPSILPNVSSADEQDVDVTP